MYKFLLIIKITYLVTINIKTTKLLLKNNIYLINHPSLKVFPVYDYKLSGGLSSLGSKNNALIAKRRKTTPPIIVTVRTDIRCAIIRPPMTAIPVQMACPITPPIITP